MNYSALRKLSYKTERKTLRTMNINIDDWFYSPYTMFKTRFYIEGACILVFFLQHTRIKPNWISLLYMMSGVIGAILLGSGVDNLIVAGVIVLFSKIILDAVDGLLARVTRKTSNTGDLLDSWGGLVSEYSFLIGFGMYLFNATQEILYIYLLIFMLFAKSLDLRDYTYHYLMYSIYKSKKFIKKIKDKKKKLDKKEKNTPQFLIFLKNFFQSVPDYRGRTVDLVGLLIIIELNLDKVIATNFIYYLFSLKVILLSLGGFYLAYYKDFITQIMLKLRKDI